MSVLRHAAEAIDQAQTRFVATVEGTQLDRDHLGR
jgi:hypothetical protein